MENENFEDIDVLSLKKGMIVYVSNIKIRILKNVEVEYDWVGTVGETDDGGIISIGYKKGFPHYGPKLRIKVERKPVMDILMKED